MLISLLLWSAVQAAADTVPLAVRPVPATPWIEQDPAARGAPQFLNFDLVVTNGGAEARTLVEVRMSAYDSARQLVQRRFCDRSGFSPCIATLPEREVAPGGSAIIYNPFHTLPGDLALAELRYELVYADSAGAMVDTLRATVHPARPRTLPRLTLPVAGRVLVFDGHDALAHHRRWNLAHPVVRAVGFTGNSGRYAYDLSLVDAAGRMFRGDGARNSDWYSWEAPVRAPAAGTVVAVANDEPDWEIGRTALPDSMIFARPVSLYGNYVVIDHGGGAFSLVAHLRQGSVRVKVGERVRSGQSIAKVGYSGSVYTIHTHYQLQAGPAYAAEGLPSYFTGVRRVGTAGAPRGPVRLDSGDIVESD